MTRLARGCHRTSLWRIRSTAVVESESMSTNSRFKSLAMSQPWTIAQSSASRTCPLPNLQPNPRIQGRKRRLKALSSITNSTPSSLSAREHSSSHIGKSELLTWLFEVDELGPQLRSLSAKEVLTKLLIGLSLVARYLFFIWESCKVFRSSGLEAAAAKVNFPVPSMEPSKT